MQFIRKYKANYISLLKLAIPIIIGQLGGIITGLADTIMVGQHSTDELAAASFVNNVLNAFIIFGTGFSFALTPLIGENLARNKKYVVAAWKKNSLVANLLLSFVLMGILTVIYFNIDLLGQPEELLPLIKPYYIVSMVSVIFVMLANSYRQFLEAITDPSISMWILLSGNLLNIIGNYALYCRYFGLHFSECRCLRMDCHSLESCLQWHDTQKPARNDVGRCCAPGVIPVLVVLELVVPRLIGDSGVVAHHIVPTPLILLGE